MMREPESHFLKPCLILKPPVSSYPLELVDYSNVGIVNGVIIIRIIAFTIFFRAQVLGSILPLV
ncbi:MAG: hypothetical protein K0Q73_6519 [Paenibacillus sp.]|jgi:hypothetical protein|nr:hypothetical protein [Paenibacillus sp.]